MTINKVLFKASKYAIITMMAVIILAMLITKNSVYDFEIAEIIICLVAYIGIYGTVIACNKN
jgi:uncharacterized membrane protein